MQQFTGFEYLLIDAANQFGLDKENFDVRIRWARENLDNLESFAGQIGPKERPLFLKAVMAIRKAQRKIPTGHLVGFDACNSGLQIMSAVTGCAKGAALTGLIDPDNRVDAYGEITLSMNKRLKLNQLVVDISRASAKDAVMTSLYGSKRNPKIIFGEDTPELAVFYTTMAQEAPGAWELLHDLLASWQPYALFHAWKMPDGYDVKNLVKESIEDTLEIDELDHARISYTYKVNKGLKQYVSNAANVVHSMDAYLLRSLIRRCNYDRKVVEAAYKVMETELLARHMGVSPEPTIEKLVDHEEFLYYLQCYERSKMADVVILPYLTATTVTALDDEHLRKLAGIVRHMLTYKPFALVSVHDEFKCHANNMNHVRYWYKELLAEFAEGEILNDIHKQLTGVPCFYACKDPNLAEKIRASNYALS